MKKYALALIIVALCVTASPSLWAWGHGGGGRGWGGRGGYYGGRGYGGVSIGIGGPWWPYYYPYYDPYYAAPVPYVYPDPSVYAAPADASYDPNSAVYPDSPPSDADLRSPSYEPSAPPVDDSRHDLRRINERLSRLRALFDYKYSDGDIDKTQHDAGVRYLGQIDQEARAEAGANGGTLTGDQEASLLHQLQQVNPGSSRAYPSVVPTPAAQSRAAAEEDRQATMDRPQRDASAINDLLLELRALLDQKVKDGSITKPQRDAEAAYLDQIDKKAHAGGALSESQESNLVQQLHQAYYAINHNLIVH